MHERKGEGYGPLVDQPLGRSGMQVKLDKGFEPGTYEVYIQYDGLATQTGFRAANRKAFDYCTLLKNELGRLTGISCGTTEDPSRSAAPGRKRDLDTTFLSFPIETSDGRYHDRALKEQFRVAFLRTGQAWDQTQARSKTVRQNTRQEKFRQQLEGLLQGEAYSGIDGAVRERLLVDILALAFPPKEIGL